MIVKFHFIKVKLPFVLVCCYGFWYSLFYNLLYCLGCLSFFVLLFVVRFYVEYLCMKAYTKSTIDIFEVPCFSEFDIWQKDDYSKNDFNKMNDLTLYLVKSRVRNLFFNRAYNLIYGKFLSK